MNEYRFHKWIEEQDPEGKERVRKKVEERLGISLSSHLTTKKRKRVRDDEKDYRMHLWLEQQDPEGKERLRKKIEARLGIPMTSPSAATEAVSEDEKEYCVHQWIEEQNPEEKARGRKKVEEKLGISISSRSNVKKQKTTKVKWVTLCATVACAVCLLIALPFIINNSLKPKDNTRYCQASDYTIVQSDYSIQDYNTAQGKNLLHFDYATVEEHTTQRAVSNSDANDIIFFKETYYVGDDYNQIDLFITDDRTIVETLQGMTERSTNSSTRQNVAMKWACEGNLGTAIFTYNRHKYYLSFDYDINEADMFQMIDGMFL